MKAQLKVEWLDRHWRLMLPLHRAFITEVGRAGAGDKAFTLALVLTRVLDTWSYKSFSAYAAAQESGLSMPELTRAVEELVGLGALDVRKKTFLGRTMTLYRLGKAIVSRTGFFVAPPVETDTAHGDADE
ncbi:hypothetical protein PQR34_46200 [Paraburkholderia sediminicola]|uniref:hypothetical protein n=1 Tax=Paraburkholderia sediminicola TaxID=458836 RepID=UPI0038BB1F01